MRQEPLQLQQNGSHSSAPEASSPLERIIEDAATRFSRGEHPDPSEYAARHPQFEREIREAFSAIQLMERLGREQRQNDSPTNDHEPRSARSTTGSAPQCLIGKTLGDFRLVRLIGRGGMGEVYEAEQISLQRSVALKVLPREVTRDAIRFKRFEREARAAGRLHHTNIVPVFGFSRFDDTVFYIMQLIHGQDLVAVIRELRRLRAEQSESQETDGSDDSRTTSGASLARSLYLGRFDGTRAVDLSDDALTGDITQPLETSSSPLTSDRSTVSANTTDRSAYWDSVARMGLEAANALGHAHAQGIRHRDIKPSNLLLDMNGTVWVTDFGLAKAIDDPDLSLSSDLVGTLRYMPPERFEGIDDEKSDQYALGLTLYELLAFKPAYSGSGHAELLKRVTEARPRPLREIDPAIPGDLAVVIQKAIEREPERRYSSCGEMAADLQRFLDRRPVHARHISNFERFALWCRRNPTLAASNIAVATLTLVVAVVSTVAALRLQGSSRQLAQALSEQKLATKRAEGAEHASLLREYEAHVAQARASRFSGRKGQRTGTLEAVREAQTMLPRLGLAREESQRRLAELRDLAVAALALADLEQNTWPDLPGIDADPTHYVVSADLTLRCRHDRKDGTLVVTRAVDDSEVARLPGKGIPRGAIYFSPDNQVIAFSERGDPNQWLWTIGEPVARAIACPAPRGEIAFSPDSRFLYVPCPEAGLILRADSRTGAIDQSYSIPRLPLLSQTNLAVSPGGNRLAFAIGRYMSPESHIVRILDLETGKVVTELPFIDSVQSLAWNPSGTQLAAGATNEGQVWLWDMTKSPPVRFRVFNENRQPDIALAFNNAGTMLACASNWGTSGLTVYEANTLRELLHVPDFTLHGFPRRMPGHNSNQRITATADFAGRLVQSDIIPGSLFRSLTREIPGNENYQQVSIHKNNRLAAGGTHTTTVLWDLVVGRQVAELPAGGSIGFEPNGGALWTSDYRAGKLRWPIHDEGSSIQIGPPTLVDKAGSYDHPIRTSEDGRIIAFPPTFGSGALVFAADAPDKPRRVAAGTDIRNLSVSPDGRFVLTRQHTVEAVSLWDAASGDLVRKIEPGDMEGNREIWRLWASPRALDDTHVGSRPINVLFLTANHGSFTRDYSLTFKKNSPGHISVLETATSREVLNLNAPLEESYRSVAVSPDGAFVLATGTDNCGGVRMWNLRQLRKELAAMGLDWDAPAIPDWPDGDSPKTPLKVEVIEGPIHNAG